jgi:hypothetical protein
MSVGQKCTETAETKVLHRRWDSMTEYAEWLDSVPPVAGILGSGTRSSEEVNNFRTKWTGTASLPAARDLAGSGTWTKPLKRVDSLVSGVKSRMGEAVAKREPKRVNSMVGARVNMSRYLAGRPDCMVRVKPQVTKGRSPVVRMVFNFCASSGTDTDDMITRGAAITALVEIVQRAGWQVEVIAVSGHGPVEYGVRVKEAGRYMAPADLLFSIAHPSMLRRLVFAALERESVSMQSSLGYGYGKVTDLCKETIEEADILIDAGMLYGHTPETGIVDWVLSKVEGLNLSA